MTSIAAHLTHWQGWLALAAVGAYFVSAWLVRRRSAYALRILGLGLALHAPVLAVQIVALEGLRYGFAAALSATLWLAVLVLAWEARSSRLDGAMRVVAPVAGVSVVLPWVFVGTLFQGEVSALFLPHLVIGTLAYGVYLLAATLAAFILVQARVLQSRHSLLLEDGVFDQMPPLLAMERMLFRYLGIGFGLLTVTLLSGLVFSEEVFGRPLRLDHKSLLTLLAWAVFGVLLWGHRTRGWRGVVAARATLAGFVALLLGYVGSRFVLEVILQRGPGR